MVSGLALVVWEPLSKVCFWWSRSGQCQYRPFGVSLSTGNRGHKTVCAEQSHINLEERLWYIPSANQKHSRGKTPPDRFVDLSDFAMERMRALLALNPGGKSLFPKDTKEGTPEEHAAEGTLTKTWLERQTQRSETRPGRRPIGPERKPRKTEEVCLLDLPGGHWTTHDLPRTLGTISKRLGFDNETLDKCLHHTTGTMLQRNYIIDDDRKKMIELWHALGLFCLA